MSEVIELHAQAPNDPPPPLRMRLRSTALPSTLCRSCWTFHKPAEPCGPSEQEAA